MSRLYLHLGYPKTGTTTLQRAFFDVLYREGYIHYLGMFGFATDPAPDRKAFFAGLTRALYLDDETAFSDQAAGLRDQFDRLCAGVPGQMPIVLSNEHFVLSQWSTKLEGERILPARTADRLGQIFAGLDVGLMLAVRRQDELLRSMYIEHASRAQHANPEHYQSIESYIGACLDPDDFHHLFYDFDSVTRAYRAAFPQSEVLIWTYESFRQSPPALLSRISSFIGLGASLPPCIPLPLERHNAKSNNGAAVTLKRWSQLHRLIHALPFASRLADAHRSNPLFWRLNDFLKSRQTIGVIDPAQAALLLGACRVSNKRLAEHFPGLMDDVLRFGYLDPAD